MKQKGPGRPSKLTDAQWAEAGRMLAMGDSYAKVAKHFKVGKSTLIERFSARLENIKVTANKLVDAEVSLDSLPKSDQVAARTLADQLKGISHDLARAARAGAKVAAIASEKATETIETAMRLAEEAEFGVADPTVGMRLMQVGGLVALSNKAGELGMGLLAANKAASSGTSTLEDLVTGGGK